MTRTIWVQEGRTGITEAAKTRILVLSYSQTGQLARAAESLVGPLALDPEVEIVWGHLEPKRPYPFPWSFLGFLDVFPEAVFMDPPELAPLSFDPDSHFDLVVLAYQVWFLSPSLPVTAFLRSTHARVLRGKPVVTLIACRNMWLTAHAKMQKALTACGAMLIDNIVLTDRGSPWSTFITTPRWLLTGKKAGFWRIFPAAGVADADIAATARFGRALRDQRAAFGDRPSRSLLQGLRAVTVDPRYIASERVGHRSFLLWGRLLRALGPPGTQPRRAVLIFYAVFLAAMIITVVPITWVFATLLHPVLKARLARAATELERPSGRGSERLADYQ
ncbi:MAG TPA: dialkylresorcinol condensing enzyme [Acidiferrobacter sp.]|nr:dialkylresorcinol condensing enzyme [Acidiferrobacter sp.]